MNPLETARIFQKQIRAIVEESGARNARIFRPMFQPRGQHALEIVVEITEDATWESRHDKIVTDVELLNY